MQIPSGAAYGSNLNGSGVSAPTRIAALQARIKLMLKRIEDLGKSLIDAPLPEARKAIVKEIMLMQQEVHLVQVQIAELEKRASRKMRERLEPPEAEAEKVNEYRP